MQFSILGSGSKGNCTLIELDDTAILIDAGFSGKEMESRIAHIGVDIAKVKAIFLTHEHNDHIAGAGVFSRRFHVPVYANRGTFDAAESKLNKLYKKKEFVTGDCITINKLTVRSFRTSHDTADPVGYTVSDGNVSLGYLTDTGIITRLMSVRLQDCHTLILECNHDLEMLRNGSYPLALQQRVRSTEGHLCNDDAAAFLSTLNKNENPLRHLILAHLSDKNNTPDIALATISPAVKQLEVEITIAMQDIPLPLSTV